MCAWPIKLSLSLLSQIQLVFTKTLYGEGVCVYINACIHKCLYVCTYAYTEEKKELDLLQRQSLFFH